MMVMFIMPFTFATRGESKVVNGIGSVSMQYGLDEDIAKVIPLLDLQMDFLSIYD